MPITRLLIDGIVPGSQSLKDKRRVLNSIRDRYGKNPHLAMAEVGEQDKWQRVELVFVSAGSCAMRNRQALNQLVDALDEEGMLQILEARLEDLE